jgi:CBS domain-containing membrane protein
MGASAVLLFAVPASPLAQPWSIAGGNLISAFIGVSCAKLIGVPVVAAALAISLAIGAMLALRCLHPPSGAVALMAVVGGPQVIGAGYGFVWAPVALNTGLLLCSALLYNRLVGRRYPNLSPVVASPRHRTTDLDPIARIGFSPADLREALRAANRLLDISVEDLDAIFRKTEMQAYGRHFGKTLCRSVMSRDTLSAEYATELSEAWQLMHLHKVHALPVIDRGRRVIGIVTRSDFLAHADLHDQRSIATRLRGFLKRTPNSHSEKHEVVGQIMSTPARTAQDFMPIVELVPLMADLGLHHVPIVDANRRLVGMVTQTDMVAALYETSLGNMGERQPATA